TNDIIEDYKGYKTITLSDEDMANFYENLEVNHFDLYTNQYLILQGSDGVVDKFRWDGNKHVKLKFPKGSKKKAVKPKNDEQAFVLDLLYNNDIPIKIVSGTYGSGKTFLTVK